MASPANMATGWLEFFKERRSPSMFLSSFFTTKNGGTYYGRKIEVDIKRFSENVAVVVKRGTGANLNDASLITTKDFEPPQYGEAFPADVEDLLERTVGVDPYEDAENPYMGKLIGRIMDYFMEGYDMIVRGLELQASQILQTGRLALTDTANNAVFSVDFQPKATHFPTVSTSWSASGATPLADLQSLAEVIRRDGKISPDTLLIGEGALRHFLANDEVQAQLDNRRIEIGDIMPRQTEGGGTYYGDVWIGAYRFMIWTYGEFYQNPANANEQLKYLNDQSVVMLKTMGAKPTRLDRISAAVPLPLGPDPRIASLIPGRLIDTTSDIDVVPNLYPTPDGRQIMAEVLARTLLAPIQIDGYGCLDTEV